MSFPRAIKQYTSMDVLTEEHQDAVPLEYFLQHGGGAFDHRLANVGLDAFLSMLLIDNFCHADLHPGNIFVKFYRPSTSSFFSSIWARLTHRPERAVDFDPDDAEIKDAVHTLRRLAKQGRAPFLAELERLNTAGFQPEIVFIDTGLVTSLSDSNRRNFLDLFQAVAEFDGYRAGRLMIERCRTPDLVLDPETFALKMQHLVLSVKSQTFSLAKIRIADVLTQVLENVRAHHVKLEADFVNTVLSILLLEGIGRQLDPDMDLFKAALPIMRHVGAQMTAHDVLARRHVDVRELGNLLKVWIWIEARQLASVATESVDEWLRYDLCVWGPASSTPTDA